VAQRLGIILNFLGVMLLAPSSQCELIAGPTMRSISESDWWQFINIVGWFLLSVGFLIQLIATFDAP
jgi:lipid-A-disaccharide synthase-like uncharacterized protein